jgi:hypothetical protein
MGRRRESAANHSTHCNELMAELPLIGHHEASFRTITSIHLKSSRLSSGPSAGANHTSGKHRESNQFALQMNLM